MTFIPPDAIDRYGPLAGMWASRWRPAMGAVMAIGLLGAGCGDLLRNVMPLSTPPDMLAARPFSFGTTLDSFEQKIEGKDFRVGVPKGWEATGIRSYRSAEEAKEAFEAFKRGEKPPVVPLPSPLPEMGALFELVPSQRSFSAPLIDAMVMRHPGSTELKQVGELRSNPQFEIVHRITPLQGTDNKYEGFVVESSSWVGDYTKYLVSKRVPMAGAYQSEGLVFLRVSFQKDAAPVEEIERLVSSFQ
jgi:hypothetical protein